MQESSTGRDQITPTCEMTKTCSQPVTMIDSSGFVYCSAHGLSRQGWRLCRKLRPYEIRRLERGDSLTKY